MKYLILAAGLFHLFFLGLEAAAQNFMPMTPGNIWTYQMPGGLLEKKILEQKLTYKGFEYFQEEVKYPGQTVTNYYRIDNLGNRWYLDPVSMIESIDIPGELNVGYTWNSADGAWEYRIDDLDGVFKSPAGIIKNCLVIKARQLTGRDKNKAALYYNFFADNIGQVGSVVGKRLILYLTKHKLR